MTIGGDDTASGAAAVARASRGQLAIAHVPKTIDNDLPLPTGIPTFGFTTAVDVSKDLVRNLMKDAATTDKWFFVTVMGRHAGHLALGIGSAAGATLTVIGEEFPEGPVSLWHRLFGERRLSPGSEGTVTAAKGGSSGAGGRLMSLTVRNQWAFGLRGRDGRDGHDTRSVQYGGRVLRLVAHPVRFPGGAPAADLHPGRARCDTTHTCRPVSPCSS